MAAKLPSVPRLKTVTQRLLLIFPEGIEHRNYCVREMAARTVWVMLYAAAVEGLDRWIRPSQVTDMGKAQAKRLSDEERDAWYRLSLSPRKDRPADAWYAPNSREPIRDETIRQGLIPTGAIVDRPSLPTTSSLPRYALQAEFAALFDENLDQDQVFSAAEVWRGRYLSKAALARLALRKRSAAASRHAVSVRLPNGETRNLSPGRSSVIAKALIEEFAPRFLHTAAVLWLSESGNKMIAADDSTAAKLGLRIDPARALPDVILADLGPELLVVFAEIVATNGAITELRKEALRTIAIQAGFGEAHLAYVTAFEDRSAPAYRKAVSDLAWGSFVWFASEPDRLIILRDGLPAPIASLR